MSKNQPWLITGAASFKELMEEIREKYPFVNNIVYFEHYGSWEIVYEPHVPKELVELETEWETFFDVLACLEKLSTLPEIRQLAFPPTAQP